MENTFFFFWWIVGKYLECVSSTWMYMVLVNFIEYFQKELVLIKVKATLHFPWSKCSLVCVRDKENPNNFQQAIGLEYLLARLLGAVRTQSHRICYAFTHPMYFISNNSWAMTICFSFSRSHCSQDWILLKIVASMAQTTREALW